MKSIKFKADANGKCLLSADFTQQTKGDSVVSSMFFGVSSSEPTLYQKTASLCNFVLLSPSINHIVSPTSLSTTLQRMRQDKKRALPFFRVEGCEYILCVRDFVILPDHWEYKVDLCNVKVLDRRGKQFKLTSLMHLDSQSSSSECGGNYRAISDICDLGLALGCMNDMVVHNSRIPSKGRG